MLRRKLALYTLLYIAGITAGFFMFERSRAVEAAGFGGAVIAAVLFTHPSGRAAFFVRKDRADGHYQTGYIGKHTDLKKEVMQKQKAILVVFFLAGFLLFSFRSLTYGSALEDVQDKESVRGRVISATLKDDRLRLIIKNSGKGPSKVLVTLDRKATERSLSTSAYGFTGLMIEARGEFTEIPPADDPGCFDYSLYMKSKGVSYGFKAYIVEVTETRRSPGSGIRLSLYNARESFISRFDEDTQGFIRGVIFGDKSGIDEDLLEEFSSNSTGHILAVSGLHIGFLYGLLRFLTARRRTLPVSVFIIAVILLYGEMTMWSPATVRACIVMTISLCGAHLRRRSDLLTSVSLAAFLILTFQPYQLFNSGFQLSFLALCGIAFLTGPISLVTGEAIAVLLAVQAGTLPVIAYSYCRINPLSILINIPVILLASVLVPLCILLLMFEVSVLWVPAAGIDLAELISYAVIRINHILSFDGGFSVKTAGPGAAVITCFYVMVFGLASEWTRVVLLRKEPVEILKQGILLLMPMAMLFSCMYDKITDDEIVFVAVGQGDCVHVRSGDRDVLIDGGGQADHGSSDDKNEDGYNVGENILMPYLLHNGTDAVEVAVVTHLHADHYKGIVELSEIYPVGAIGIPIDYRGSFITQGSDASCSDDQSSDPHDGDTSCSGNQISDPHDGDTPGIIYIRSDTSIKLADDVSIDVIWPVKESEEPIEADDPNEHNTVYMIHYKGIKVMVTGDLLEADEHEMVEYYKDTDTLKCDILKVAHHGSKSSSSEEFLDAASPRTAVIQVGRNNFYGHPHRQTLDRLEKRGIKVYRTDMSGAVGIDIHGSRLSVDLFRQELSK